MRRPPSVQAHHDQLAVAATGGARAVPARGGLLTTARARFGDLPIRRKLTWVYVVTSGIALLLASIAFLTFEVSNFHRDMVRTIAAQAGIASYNCASALLANDRDAARETLAALRAEPHIVAAAVYTRNGEAFASYVRRNEALPAALELADGRGNGQAFLPDALLVYRDIVIDGELVGSIRVLADLEELNALVLRYSGIVVVVFFVSLAAALPLLSRFQRVISGPIMHLVERARIVSSQKNYGVRATRTSSDELGLLVDTFNEMLSEIQQRDAALERARDGAEAANRAKDEFLAIVSHELRTPLTPILAWARMLRGGQLDADGRQRAVEIIERNARSQAQLIEDLLDVSRIISGKLRLDVRPVDMLPLVEAAVDSVRPTADMKSVQLGTVIDPTAGQVAGDPERLKQVLWNLLSNAIKFTPKGGRVQVILRRTDGHVELVVSDTGEGIAAEFLPYVFDRFRQADATSTRTHGGLGLGLAIVRHLVELHGGQARVASEGRGRGATFVVELPISPLAASPQRVRPVASDVGVLAATSAEIHGLRVLAVDDDDDTLETLRVLLQQHGAEVRTAASAESALEVFGRWNPDLIISDIGMPGTDGYELIRQVRARPVGEGGRVPALALTAYARIEDRLQVLSAGFQMHVPKPIEPAELIAVVASLAEWTRE